MGFCIHLKSILSSKPVHQSEGQLGLRLRKDTQKKKKSLQGLMPNVNGKAPGDR